MLPGLQRAESTMKLHSKYWHVAQMLVERVLHLSRQHDRCSAEESHVPDFIVQSQFVISQPQKSFDKSLWNNQCLLSLSTRYDYVEVEDLTEKTILGRWCGSQSVQASHTSKGSQIRIRFVSDEYFPSEPGFCLRYSLLPVVRTWSTVRG